MLKRKLDTTDNFVRKLISNSTKFKEKKKKALTMSTQMRENTSQVN